MRNKKLVYLIFAFFLSLSLRKIFCLKSGVIPGHNWDWSLPNVDFLFNKINILSKYNWWDFDLGKEATLAISHLIPNSMLSLWSCLFSPKIVILTLLISIITISFVSFKKLLDISTIKTDINYLPAFLYAFSPFLFNDIIGGSWYIWMSYAFVPFWVINLLKYISTKLVKYLVGFLFSSIFLISSPQHFLLIETIVVFFLVHKILVRQQEIKSILFRYSFAHTMLIICNLYWIIPFISSFPTFCKTVIQNTSFAGANPAFRSSTQDILNILLLTGYHNRNMYYHALPNFMVSIFIISILFIWVLVVFPMVAKKQSLEYKAYPWLFIFLLLIILIKGGNPPFSGFTMWFYNMCPIMKLYRSPQHLMFAAAFITPVLMACSLNYLYKNLKCKKIILCIFSFCIFIWTSGWWYNGDLGHKILKKKQKDYIDFYELSPGLQKVYERNEKSSINYRILFLPAVLSPQHLKTEYQNKAQGGLPEYLYLKNGIFVSEFNFFANEIEYSFCKEVDFNFINYLRLFAVKDIVLRYDIYPHFTESAKCWDSDRAKRILESSAYLDKFLEGKYEIGYSIKSKYFLPHIYSTFTPIIIDGNIESIISLAETEYLDGKPALFFDAQEENKGLKKRNDIPKLIFSHNKWELLNKGKEFRSDDPEITFQKINPTKYKLKIKDAKGPFWLVFSESFHPQWRAYVKPEGSVTRINENNFKEIVAEYPRLGVKEARHLQKFSPQDIEYLFRKQDIKEHYLVNGYANAWYIYPEELELGEDFIVVLYFWPQSLFYLGLGISGFAFIGCIGYLGFDFTKRKFRYAKGNQNFN